MAKRKTKKKFLNDNALKTNLKRGVAGLVVLVILVVVAGVLAHHFILRKQPAPYVPSSGKSHEHKLQAHKMPKFEIYPEKDISSVKPIAKPKAQAQKKIPRVAIIIDDMGYNRKMAEKFLELDAVLTISVLPFSPFQKNIVRAAQAKGWDTMLHLPMEPIEYPKVNPGIGALLTSMTPDQLISQLNENLDAIPTVKGVNNHMGSKMTTISTQMYQIFSVLKKRELFFIDSRTTFGSLCKPSARLFQIPFSQRDVFLDHVQDPNFIRRQIKKLVQIANSKGEAVGIGHPFPVTYQVLSEVLPNLQKKVLLVPASSVVHIVG